MTSLKDLAQSEENKKRIAHVDACFGGMGRTLLTDNRTLIGEGILTKVCRKKAKPRVVFLFNDVMVYGTILINKKKYANQKIIPLELVTINEVLKPEDFVDNLSYGFQVCSPGKSFTLFAPTEEEKRQWVSHILDMKRHLLKERGLRDASVEAAAVWVPDGKASRCMLCNLAEFTVLQRRHHCRKCGLVVCQACSQKRWILPHISQKPVRVCDSCYAQLSKSQYEQAVNAAPKVPYSVDSESDSSDDNLPPERKPSQFYQDNSD